MDWIGYAVIFGVIGAIIGSIADKKDREKDTKSSESEDYTPKCSHSWTLTGINEKQLKEGDPNPNKYFTCSRCGERKINHR